MAECGPWPLSTTAVRQLAHVVKEIEKALVSKSDSTMCEWAATSSYCRRIGLVLLISLPMGCLTDLQEQNAVLSVLDGCLDGPCHLRFAWQQAHELPPQRHVSASPPSGQQLPRAGFATLGPVHPCSTGCRTAGKAKLPPEWPPTAANRPQ